MAQGGWQVTSPPRSDRDRVLEAMAKHLQGRFGNSIPWEELYDLGVPAIVKARAEWDGRGHREAFLMQRARWGILDALRKARRDARTMAVAATELSAREHVKTRDQLLRAQDPERDAEINIDEIVDNSAASYAIDIEAGERVPFDGERLRLRRAVEELPPPEDQVIHLYCYLGKTFEEVAKDLGIGESTVRDTHKRAIARLKRLFPDADAPPDTVRLPASPEH